jgi:hypothetical protein
MDDGDSIHPKVFNYSLVTPSFVRTASNRDEPVTVEYDV